MLIRASKLSRHSSPPAAVLATPLAGVGRRTCACAVALVALVIVSMCAPAYSPAASSTCDKFASPRGSDTNPGTAAAPFATAKHLFEELAAGETGCLASGQTFAGFTLYAGNTHGAEGKPVTLTSTNPEDPAIIDSRIVTEKGTNWLTFTHLALEADALGDEEDPSPTVGSAHTTWTYDDISGGDIDICLITNPVGDTYGTAEYTLLEHDRVHDCGHPLTHEELECQVVSKPPVCSTENVDVYEGRLNGWHAHGLYNMGQYTTVRNSYFYHNSGLGILLRAGTGAVIEHNVIDGNGRGVEFGNEGPTHSTVAWNLITSSTDPCAKEAPTGYRCDTFGVSSCGSYPTEVGPGNVTKDNDVYGNEGGNIAPSGDLSSAIALEHNIEVNPRYVNAAAHEYALQAGSPVLGYGPETAQPTTEPTPPETEPTPPETEPTPPVTEPTPPTIEPTPPGTEPTPPSAEPTPSPDTNPLGAKVPAARRRYRHAFSSRSRDRPTAARSQSRRSEDRRRRRRHRAA
jgi:hypothetical protein